MDSFALIEKNAEKVTGLSVSKLREYGPGRFREYLESRKGTLRFRSFFPVIGRGNVLRDSLVTSSEIDSEIDKILED
jgi:hypothetical protein